MFAFLRPFVFFLLLPVAAVAQTYPHYDDLYVNDFAGLLSDTAKQASREKLWDFKRDTGIEFTVVTIRSFSEYGYSGEIEPFATGLFNTWGVGNADRNDGVMMLISKEDRKMRLEVGSGYGASKNSAMQRIIDDVILPEFRSNRFSAGIVLGIDAVIEDLTAEPITLTEKIGGWVQALFVFLGKVVNFLFYPILAGLAGFAVWMYRRFLWYRARICPADSSKMELLAEHWDDAHLRDGQLKEEEINSVDYDVWRCPKCERLTIEAYKTWFSQYSACRSCKFRTLQGETEILEHATTQSTGKKKITYTCLNCDDTYAVTKVIPKKSESSSSSSSSSSFGGGSSSGGGASGSW
ncbi:TPM domain-containing protein [Roseovarius phycicola]|uniref:TPM domain-containing protein n=1 Tax=Roseovarius phycicola TaxID=3080976 RepID=A0ABZ2HFE9_9RHOB